jgi:DNA-binding NtrC family response regulator
VVGVDCRAPGADQQLFGGRTRVSAFARADGGTLLLLGLDGLPKAHHPRLLDILGRGLAPGPDGGEIRFDVRLYSTARSSPSLLAARGELPFELANLCAGVEVELPPLRERSGDLPLLLEHFARALAPRGSGVPLTFSAEALAILGQHAFPGNVREAHNLVERLTLLQVGEVQPAHLPPETRASPHAEAETLSALVERVEREAISRAMARAHGKKVEAAKLLDISRPTLDKKLAEYGLGTTRKRTLEANLEDETTDASRPRPRDDDEADPT